MSAILSECGFYRYRLDRTVATAGKTAAIIMVNPSTADATTNDASIRRWIGFSGRFGIARFIVGNKFAYRATDVRQLAMAKDPIGPENNYYLEQIMSEADLHIVAWGRLSKLPVALRQRWLDVLNIADRVGCELFCLGTTLDGHPKHPVRLSYAAKLVRWRRKI
jgi:hypothetical protein